MVRAKTKDAGLAFFYARLSIRGVEARATRQATRQAKLFQAADLSDGLLDACSHCCWPGLASPRMQRRAPLVSRSQVRGFPASNQREKARKSRQEHERQRCSV